MNTYNLFVSHSWRYSNSYERFINLLTQRRYFSFRDYSIPPDDPIHSARNENELRDGRMGGIHHAPFAPVDNVRREIGLGGVESARKSSMGRCWIDDVRQVRR